MELSNHKAGFVNIIGLPNVGKSTLMNALVGEKLAIITPKAQTTRHRIFGIVNEDDYQIVYSDSPGIIHEPQYKLQESMMKFVQMCLRDADILIVLLEAKQKTPPPFFERIKKVPVPKIVVLNKADVITKEEAEAKLAFWKTHIEAEAYIAVSALQKKNLTALSDQILAMLPLHPPYYGKDDLTDKPLRFFASEIIREKIFLNFKQEIPYSVEIAIEVYQEEEDIARIRAIIFVDRESQKPIVIGRKGSMLKKVGTEARIDMEAFIEKKVYLELFVKVKKNWRNDDDLLKKFGYRG